MLLCLFLLYICCGILDASTVQKAWAHKCQITNQMHDIRFTETPAGSDSAGAPVLCIHGFGGNADQYRKNVPRFAESGYNSFAFDLLGYGFSDKPDPKLFPLNALYNFDVWAEQTKDFVDEVIKEPAVLVCNSVGGLVGLQTAAKYPDRVKGLVLINISLRMLHNRKQPALQVPFTTALQTVLRETGIGKAFFKQVATPQTLKNILSQAYGNKEDVNDEIVDVILKPGLTPGAADVFLDFISYSSGPLPEDLFPQIDSTLCPIRLLWGEEDPWEPIAMGKKLYAPFADEFVPLKGAGHCPMDQVSYISYSCRILSDSLTPHLHLLPTPTRLQKMLIERS